MIDRTPGEGRYAREEREQRWVLRALPHGCAEPVAIVDLYISGTRLRLRRMAAGTAVVYKLGQKVRHRPGNPERVKLTNIYLSSEEHAALARLGGAEITKTRWQSSGGDRPMAVDEFLGPLAGLILAEVGLAPQEARTPDPPLAVADVTDDDRFSGGRLAVTTAPALADLLAGLGLRPKR